MINVASFMRNIRRHLKTQVSNSDLTKIRRDKEQEVWDFAGKYSQFIRRKTQNITSRVQNQANRQILQSVNQGRLKNIAWSIADPKRRAGAIRDLINSIFKDLLERDERKNQTRIRQRRIKKRQINRRRTNRNTPNPNPKTKTPPKTPAPGRKPSPNNPQPIEGEDEVFVPQEPPQSIPPPAVKFPVESGKSKFSSRVGYFVSISDLYYYNQEESILDEKRIVFKFDEQPNGVLSLSEGEVWHSPWQDAGVIRAVDINVHGQTKLNYLKNPTFEI